MAEYLKVGEHGQLADWGLSIFDVRTANPGVFFIDDGADHSHLGYPLAVPAAELEVRRWQEVRKLPPVHDGDRWISQAEVVDLPLMLEDKRAEVKNDADMIARTKRDHVVLGISPAEMASWPIKRFEALALQSGSDPTSSPSLAAEAAARGIALADLVAKVLANSSRLALLEAEIAGRCGAIRDAAGAATTDAELLAIDLEAGWPV